MRMRWLVLGLMILAVICAEVRAAGPAPASPAKAVADVVVIVDTSKSMQGRGMDPERTSLLVTKLFSDIVPGDLAVVRLLDLSADASLLPSRGTGRMEPCKENPSQQCEVVEAGTDWEGEARKSRLGALVRPAQGDLTFKQQLDGHLEQRSNNSLFALGFRAAQGVFDQHTARAKEVPRIVLWLSDGKAEDEPLVRRAVSELRADGVSTDAIVFGEGDVRLARELGLQPRQVSTPAQLMKAFAGAYRRIVGAPYEIDNVVASAPTFTIRRDIDEAWVVVYGDDSLGEVWLTGPAGRVAVDFAQDSQPKAGAYRVAYLERPAAGEWTVNVRGGGSGAAYAVVQRSALAPALISPSATVAGTRVPLVVGIRSGSAGGWVRDPAVLREFRVRARVEGKWVDLTDDGKHGDAAAGDGRFSGWVTFPTVGEAPVLVHARSPAVDRTVEAVVKVTGDFVSGGPVEVDFGALKAGSEACRPVRLIGRHQGAVPFELRALARPASGHSLELHLPKGVLRPGEAARPIAPGEPLELCLETSRGAPSSTAAGEPWLELRMSGTTDARHAAVLRLRWQVQALSFWERWGWLILLILAILVVLFLIGGFVLPKRFQPALAVTFVPDRRELDEQTPQPVAQWRGVGIGFYRNARAFLHSNFRLTGSPRGALAGLFAESAGTLVRPGRGSSLYRENLDGGWDNVALEGRKARSGDVYRIGDSGPFFRISSRRGRG